MGFVVKNTTKCGVLDLICPHSCRGCGQLGAVLCERCKKYMLEQYQPLCPICKQKFAESAEKVGNIPNMPIDEGCCPNCEMPFAGLWAFGLREGVLEKLVEEYKYQSVRAIGSVLVECLDYMLPEGLEEVVVVPLPTIGKHVRERGLDHTRTVAKLLAKKRGWKCEKLLVRAADTVQVGAKVAERKAQAEKAYEVRGRVDAEARYLLLDDVWTTGSTMRAAEKVLRKAGAKEIYAAVLAVSR